MKNSLIIKNAVFYAYHGVFSEEQNLGRKFEVDAERFFDFSKAVETDKLENTINYTIVYNMIHEFLIKNKYYLIEKIAVLLARKILEQFKQVEKVAVRVRKCNPPVGGLIDSVEAKVELSRDE
ncbi:MAG: dihydroneopterin aldolase [Ignavibacteria bacterium]|nr:dihydroneopterin aldolase [Ignavibacteria bacterium]